MSFIVTVSFILKHLQYLFKIKFELCDLIIIESLLINIDLSHCESQLCQVVPQIGKLSLLINFHSCEHQLKLNMQKNFDCTHEILLLDAYES